MDEAKAIINVREGIIELSGPVEFVRTYLDRYQTGPVPEKTKPVPRKTKPAPKKVRAAPGTCIGALRGFIDSGFFNEQRSFGDVKKHLSQEQVICPEKTVRAGVARLVKTGVLNVTGKRRAYRYSRPE